MIMKTMKNIRKTVLVICAILALFTLTSCRKKVIGIVPAYIGETVTDTHHEFKNEDFYIIASYDDGTDERVTDFEIEYVGMERGYYILNITYKGFSNPCYVHMELNVYPSDMSDGETGE